MTFNEREGTGGGGAGGGDGYGCGSSGEWLVGEDPPAAFIGSPLELVIDLDEIFCLGSFRRRARWGVLHYLWPNHHASDGARAM